MERKPLRILFVCMGNICRSPTAEAVFKKIVKNAGLEGEIESDSAGTHDYHIGEPPDERSQQAARRRGYDMSRLRGRQAERSDFERFDYVLAMDNQNLRLLERLCPPEHRGKLMLYSDMDETYEGREVPDPYFGGGRGFEQVLDMTEQVSLSLVERLRKELR